MIALFDMDGTLFWGDSQMRFARWILHRYPLRRLYLFIVLPACILRAVGLFDTALMKRAFLSYAWGMSLEQLERECRLFCDEELIPALYPEILACLREHQAQGDCTVLCSASPDWWTQFVGSSLGFTHTIGTPLLTEKYISLMPSIPNPGNNKGSNKLIRLANIGINHADVGYTDSAADLPMLSICDKAVLVNPKAALCKEVPDALIFRPEHPKNMLSFILRAMLGL